MKQNANGDLCQKSKALRRGQKGSRGTLANEVAQERGTPWFKEIEETLGEHYTALLSKPTFKKRNYIISVIRKKDVKAQLDRLEQQCPTTTGLYR